MGRAGNGFATLACLSLPGALTTPGADQEVRCYADI